MISELYLKVSIVSLRYSDRDDNRGVSDSQNRFSTIHHLYSEFRSSETELRDRKLILNSTVGL